MLWNILHSSFKTKWDGLMAVASLSIHALKCYLYAIDGCAITWISWVVQKVMCMAGTWFSF